MPRNTGEGMAWGQWRKARWGGGGGGGSVPREAAEYIKALAVAPVQVQAEDRWEDKHHGCKVTANHYGRLGDGQEGHKGWMKHAPNSMPTLSLGPVCEASPVRRRPAMQG